MQSIILWFPVLGAITTGFLGRYLGVTGSQITAVSFIFASLAALLITIVDYACGGITYTSILPFVDSAMLKTE